MVSEPISINSKGIKTELFLTQHDAPIPVFLFAFPISTDSSSSCCFLVSA